LAKLVNGCHRPPDDAVHANPFVASTVTATKPVPSHVNPGAAPTDPVSELVAHAPRVHVVTNAADAPPPTTAIVDVQSFPLASPAAPSGPVPPSTPPLLPSAPDSSSPVPPASTSVPPSASGRG